MEPEQLSLTALIDAIGVNLADEKTGEQMPLSQRSSLKQLLR